MAWELIDGRPMYVSGMDRYAMGLDRVAGPAVPHRSYEDVLQAERELAKLIEARDAG